MIGIRKTQKEDGFLIVSIVVTMAFMFLISISVFNLVTNNFRLATAERYRLSAQLAVDAGIDRSITELNGDASWPGTDNLDPNWTGVNDEIELFVEPSGDYRTTYESDVVDDGDDKILTVTGRTYVPSSATTAKSQRKYSVDLRSIGDAGGTFGIVTGVGGLVMQNKAKIVDGDVHVNGSITLENSAQIGTTTTSLNVDVAHYNCPTSGGPSYPSKCTSGEPISISNSAKIYGDTCAANQTTTTGLVSPGLDTGCADPASLPLPVHDRDAQKANVIADTSLFGSSGGSANPSLYYTDCDTNNSSGERTWEGQLKIVGDVYIGRKCEITIEGDVWITGSLTVAGSGKIITDDAISLGDPNTVIVDYPTIMVDDEDGVEFTNSAKALGNSADVGPQFITYWSEATCSPNCADVTGQDLFDSSDVTTISFVNSAEAENSVLFAKWSQVDMNNGGDIGALIGQTVLLRNSAAVTFGATISGGGGPSTQTWLVENYRRDF